MHFSIKVIIAAVVACLPLSALAHSQTKIKKVNPALILPTQGVVGLEWVRTKIAKLSRLSGEDLDRKLFDESAPAVIGPDGRLWLIDGHHEFRALAEMKVREAYVYIIADFGGWNWEDFVRTMRARNWFYLGDRTGRITFTPETLPSSVLQLEDDLYRSLASFLRAEGGFYKSSISHAEFQWSNALRFIDSGLVLGDRPAALKLAHEFARSDAALALPGAVQACERPLLKKEEADKSLAYPPLRDSLRDGLETIRPPHRR